jgi:hypothetical protein
MATPVLVSLSEAAAMVQPFLDGLSGFLWLTDLRRSNKRYQKRVRRPPVWCRVAGRVFYPIEEIKRIVAELDAVVKKI